MSEILLGSRPSDVAVVGEAYPQELDVELQQIFGRLEQCFGTDATPYIDSLTGLNQEVGNVGWMFPDESAEIAVSASRDIVQGAALAVERHLLQGGLTDDSLLLRGDRDMPVAFLGSEPLLALEDLRLTYWMAGQVYTNPAIAAVLTNSEDGRRIWRFIDTSGKLPSCASLYVRETGSDQVDPQYDYGKKHGYVQAKFGFNTDVDILRRSFAGNTLDEMINIGRTPQGNYANVSLRNELEPAKPTGGAAHLIAIEENKQFVPMHDVAVLNGDGRATQVGRLVAYGNDIREDGHSSHIHIEGLFPDKHSDPETFAAYIRAAEAKVTKRQLAPRQAETIVKIGKPIPESSGFHEFKLGDNPYDIGNGAVRLLAQSVGIELAADPTDEEIQQLFAVMGSEAVFLRNVAAFSRAAHRLPQAEVARLIEQTGVSGDMGLRTIDGPVDPAGEVGHGLVWEGTAAWMDKRTAYLQQLHRKGLRIGSVLLAASARPLTTPTEIAHPSVVSLYKELGRSPTAIDYMERVVGPILSASGLVVKQVVDLPAEMPTVDGKRRRTTAEDLAGAALNRHPELADDRIVLAQNAPAAWTFWPHVRAMQQKAANTIDIRQQLLFGGTGVLLAENPAELASKLHQNPWTAASAVPRFIKVIHELNKTFK